MSPTPFITVAICTYNRCKLLEETLASMQGVDYPRESWELIVIDNNSSDNTRTVVESFHESTHAPRWVFEGKQGLDQARNRAISETKGEILILADDDILVQADWITQLTAPFFQDASIACVGGSVYPVFPEGIPAWMEKDWTRPLMLTTETAPIPEGQDPMGANLAFRMSVFEAVGPFLEGLDRQGNVLLCGGDAEMVRRVRKGGFQAWFAPRAAVKHQFPRSRMNFKYAVRHGYGSACSKVIDVTTSDNYSPSSLRRYLLTRFIGNLIKGPLQALLSGLLFIFAPGKAKRTFVRASRSAGYVMQILKVWR